MLKNPEINLHIYGQLNCDKSANVIPKRKESQQMVWNNLVSVWKKEKNKIKPLTFHKTEMNTA